MNFDNKLIDDIEKYCKLNDIDASEYANNLLKKAFMEDKYGIKPEILNKKSTFVTEPEEIKPKKKRTTRVKKENIVPTIEEKKEEEIVEKVNENINLVTKKTKRKLNE